MGTDTRTADPAVLSPGVSDVTAWDCSGICLWSCWSCLERGGCPSPGPLLSRGPWELLTPGRTLNRGEEWGPAAPSGVPLPVTLEVLCV